MTTVVQLLKEKAAGSAIYSIAPDAPVLEAIKRMAEHGIGALLVMQGEQAVGVISERDYARKVILKGRTSSDTAVRDIMSSPVISVSKSDTARGCMQIMNDRRIRHLAVIENGHVLGMLSIGDLARSMLAEQQSTIEQLENYIRT